MVASRTGRCRSLFATAVAVLSLTAASAAAAAQGAGNVAAGMGGAVASPADRLDAAMTQIGLTQCAAVVDKAARFLFEDGEVNFTVQPLGPDANRWPTVIMIEGSHPGRQARCDSPPLTVSPGRRRVRGLL